MESASATLTELSPGQLLVTASDTAFAEDHIQAVVTKANRETEDAFLQRYDDLEYTSTVVWS